MQIADHRFTARRGSAALAGDVAVALLIGAAWSVLAFHEEPGTPRWIWLIAVSTAGILAWRAAPLPALALSVTAASALAGDGAVRWPPLAPLVVLYLVTAASGSRRRAVLLPSAALLAYLVGLAASGSASLQDGGHAVLGFAAAWFAGERSRLRQEQVSALHERMHAQTAAKAHEAQLALVEERSRIARDLHDSAGHAINVIAVRAGGARLRNDPVAAMAALADIEEVARGTAADIDSIVGALRERDEPSRTPIGLAAADSLVEQHRAAGMVVTTRYDADLPPLSPAADQAAFRALQEALTNAARHGTGSADVRLSGADGHVVLTVTNPTSGQLPSERRPGHGLIGMRERAATVGGTLDVERPRGYFVVRLTLPATEGAR